MCVMTRKRKWPGSLLGSVSAALLLMIPTAAAADDGRIEISSAPYTISESGSYVLTQDLGSSSAGVSGTAITISASFVTVDLNGFTIYGAGGLSWGIDGVSAGVANHVVVRNGSITGFWVAADLSEGSVIDNVRAHDNSAGLFCRLCIVLGALVESNSNAGLTPTGSSLVVDTVSRMNGTGVFSPPWPSSPGMLIARSLIAENGSGINCNGTCLVDETTLDENTGDGFDFTTGQSCAAVIDTTASGNGDYQLRLYGVTTGYSGCNLTTGVGSTGNVFSGIGLRPSLCDGGNCP